MTNKPTYEELEQRVRELEKESSVHRCDWKAPALEHGQVRREMPVDVTDRKRTEEKFRKRTHELRERVKDLNCLYGICTFVEKPGISSEGIFQGIVDLIPPAWQYPEITGARVIFRGQAYETENFRETVWKQTREIVVHGEQVGTLEVNCLEERFENNEGPFLKEERSLLNAIAERLGRIIERREAGETLRESEEKYRNLVERIKDGICVIQDSHVKFINQVMAEMLGYTVEEITDTEFTAYLHPEEVSGVVENYERRITGEKVPERYETVFRHRDGAAIDVEVNGGAIIYEGKIGDLVIARNITEKKQAEQVLRESEARFRELAELFPEAVFEANEKANLTFVNHRALDLFGYTGEDFDRGLNCLDMFVPEDRDRAAENIMKILRGEDIGIEELTALRKDGGTFPVITRATTIWHGEKPSGFRGLAIDISVRKRLEEELRESESFFRDIALSSSDWIWEIDPGGRYTFCSERVVEVLSYTPEEMLGKTPFDRMPPDEAARVENTFKEIFRNREPVVELENWNISRQGHEICFLTNGVPFFDKAGCFCGYRGVDKDITKRKQAEKEKEEIQAQLRQAQKMEAIGTLAGGIAHDFNNILMAIMGNADMALHELPEQSPARYSIEQISRASDRARALTMQILAFSRQSKQAQNPIRVGLVVKEAMKLLRASFPAIIEIRQKTEAVEDTVLADPTQIHQVVMNLCTNAYHAMNRQTGVLDVSLAPVDIDSESASKVPDLQPGSYVKLTVSDTGTGMDPDVMERIFDPYFTTKEKGTGTGMGLAVVYGIVKGHGGAITVESEPGKGTRFDLFFPLIEHDAGPASETFEPAPTGNERILFVDDEESLADLGKRMLQHLGYEVDVRTSSIEALEAFRTKPERYDLVITDTTMPHMTGPELAGELMRIRPDIPIILCTGFSEMITEDKAKDLGFKAFVMKPVSMRGIARTIRQALDIDRLTNDN
ncbi:MAG: PAS domain S-box protein [Deltaproteobacteria bacterium]|nr:PAS domain S-box protein [Deltaproteobacteria bacterium]